MLPPLDCKELCLHLLRRVNSKTILVCICICNENASRHFIKHFALPECWHPFGVPEPGCLDERQITHLICAHLKYDPSDFFRGVLGLFPLLFLV